MIKSNLQLDIVILRLLAIIIVVFFHAYGMTYANHLPESVATFIAVNMNSLISHI